MSEPKISLNALRVFAFAAAKGSFKAAADSLGVSQSAVTRQIQTLEQQLGTKLFQRDNRVHALTPAGQSLAPELLRTFQTLERSLERVKQIGDQELKLLRVDLPDDFLRFWLAPRLKDFYSIYPHIRLQFSTHSSQLDSINRGQLIERLRHQDSDLLIHQGAIKDRLLHSSELYPIRYQAVAAQPLAVSELAQQTWLIDPLDARYAVLKRALSLRAGELRTITPPSALSALDLVAPEQALALIDERFLPHLQLPQLCPVEDFGLETGASMLVSARVSERPSVGLVAFERWLTNRLNKL